jgi:hypothetical protein
MLKKIFSDFKRILGNERGFIGDSTSTTTTTNNEQQYATPTASGNVGSGGTSNVVGTTSGSITLNEESPQALNELGSAVSSLQAVASEAIEASQDTAQTTESLVGKNTESGTQEVTPIIIAVAALGAFIAYMIWRKKPNA